MANSKNLITGKRNNKTAPKTDAPAPVEAQADAPEQSEADETAQLKAQLAEMKKELANVKAKKERADGALTLKVSKKGCVSVYGMGRFPQSLYKSQWVRLAKEMPNILKFIEENDEILPEKKAAVAK